MTGDSTEGAAVGGGEMRRSVEVEYWVIDESGRLTDPGGLVDASPGAEREFVEPLLEVKTTPCESTAELRIGGEPHVGDEAVVLPPFETVRERVEDAVRDGLESDAVRSYLERMGIDPEPYEPLSAELRERGPLTEDEARRTRLDYAERLARDVRRRRPVRSD